MKTPTLLAVTLLACLPGCVHAPAPDASTPDPVADYYPLAVGNRWTYQANLLGERSVRTVEIIDREGRYFRDNQGGTLSVDEYGIRDPKRYLLRSPLTVGAGWTNVVSVASVEHYQVVSVGEPCAVPAGRFEGCVRVESRNRVDDATTMWAEFTFAPRVGMVRVRTLAERQGTRIPQSELALMKYELQSPPGTGGSSPAILH